MKFLRPFLKHSEETKEMIATLIALFTVIYLGLSIFSVVMDLLSLFGGPHLFSAAPGLTNAAMACHAILPGFRILEFFFLVAIIFSPALRNDIANFFRWLFGQSKTAATSATPAVESAAKTVETAATDAVKWTAAELTAIEQAVAKQVTALHSKMAAAPVAAPKPPVAPVPAAAPVVTPPAPGATP